MPGPTLPVANIAPSEQEVVVGAVVRLDGRLSFDRTGLDLTYSWEFTQVPIGSQVATFGFSDLEDDSSVVSFAPDISGTYRIQLIVTSSAGTSPPFESLVDVRIILVPYHQGLVPDAGFIWNYLSDFWNLVPDKKKFEMVWSSMIQVASSELLKLYQYQYNQSIRDIQELIQKRWVNYTPSLELDRTMVSFILSEETAGSLATTFIVDSDSGVVESNQPTYSDIVTVPKTEGDFIKTSFGSPIAVGRVLCLADRTLTMDHVGSTLIALTHNNDGATSGTETFTGSGFTSDMVGSSLRILSPPPLIGDYTIASFTSSSQIEIVPPADLTWAGITGVEYSVIPVPAQHTSFFADRDQVPAGLSSQKWRMSSTLISKQYDFDAQGVSAGDLIEIEILRTDIQVLSTFFVQVTGVDRNRLSFVFNLQDLVPGVAANGLTSDIQVTLASDLIVPGLSADINGNLTYALDAATINSVVNSVRFKRAYFEKTLTTVDEIDLRVFTITARPVRIIRNKKIAVDPSVVSVPILQEFIRQPDIIQDGEKTYFVANDVRTEVARAPYLLAENLDYIIDDESSVFGVCHITQGSDLITIPLGDLIDRSISEGDIIEVALGSTVESFDIRRVVAADEIQVAPLPTITSTAASFTIFRRLPGKFIRFINDTFTKKAPAPDRLWSEVTYFDNGDAIEGNFGVLVGVRREDLEKVGSGISYKNAVAGLMYALSRGPTISNLGLAGHILLGLPFAQNPGVIGEINPEFRKRDDGSPLLGRILVSGRDKFGNSTGITNIYFYPRGRQIFDSTTSTWIPAVPDSSGLAINPSTGVEYAVGDSVDQFSPLSKGVAIREYLDNPTLFDNLIAQGNVASQLQKYHAFQIVVNSDIIASVDIDLVSQFLKKAKAHYIRLTSAILKSLEDTVEIEDFLSFSRPVLFFESPDLGTPTGVKVDDDDESGSVLSLDGTFYSRYHSGSDLTTTKDSDLVQSDAGGFQVARTAFHESWDLPLLLEGDMLEILSGSNAGMYQVAEVVSDTIIQLSLGSQVFETATSQPYRVFRPLRNPIWEGSVAVTNGSQTVSIATTGIGSAGVSVGDTLVFANLSALNSTVSQKYTVISVSPSSVTPTIEVLPTPTESTGFYSAWIIREGLMTSGEIEPVGSSGEVFYANASSAGDYFTFVDSGSHLNSWLNLALLQPGSTIIVDNITYTVIRFEPGLRRAAVIPPLLTNYSDKQVAINLRPSRSTTPVSVDFLDRIPSDHLQLEIVLSTSSTDLLQTFNGSPTVTTVNGGIALITKIGDYLNILEGPDSTRDVGHGPGIFPIIGIPSDDELRLTDQSTVTGSFRYGIIRKIPNEG